MFCEIQNYKNGYYRFEIDSSPKVYELYEKIYPNSIKEKYCISTPKFFRFVSFDKGYIIDAPAPDVALLNRYRLFALPQGISAKRNICVQNHHYEMYDAVERLSGDCFFNFNRKKIKELEKINKKIDKKKLEKCGEKHHSIYNMVLLQTVGNMQGRKQKGLKLSDKYEELDRGDTFLFFLNQFYNKENEEILAESTKTNENTLRNYLSSNFKCVYDYSDKMLQINDKVFIDELIKNGKKQIDGNCVNDYLDMALTFWEKRKEIIDPMIR